MPGRTQGKDQKRRTCPAKSGRLVTLAASMISLPRLRIFGLFVEVNIHLPIEFPTDISRPDLTLHGSYLSAICSQKYETFATTVTTFLSNS